MIALATACFSLTTSVMGSDANKSAIKEQDKDKAYSDYLTGKEFFAKKKYAEGLKYYIRAAEAGHAEAQVIVGGCYISGKGVKEDVSKGFEWYIKAGRQGHPMGVFALGFLADQNRDYKRAAEFYQIAADKGIHKAQYALATLYINGWGVERNHTHAEQLLIKAANAGNTDAARLLKLYKILGYFPISKR